MGCTKSKIENEEIVNRCKERKTVMKESVSARNAFAAAHFSYAAALKNTGAALSDYAQGEVEFPDHRHPSSVDAVSSSTILPPAPPQPPPLYETPLPPPPPPLQRASTMPEFSATEPEFSHPDPIIEEVDEDNEIDDRSLKHRSSSSRKAGGGGASRSGSKREAEKVDLPPPSPPQPTPPRPTESKLNRAAPPPPQSHGMSTWDYFFPSMEQVAGSSLSEIDHEHDRFDREENHRKVDDVVPEVDHEDEEDGSVHEVDDVAPEVVEEVEEPPPPPPKPEKRLGFRCRCRFRRKIGDLLEKVDRV